MLLTQATALDYLTTYRSAYEGVFDDGVATPRNARLHTRANRRAADTAALALIKAYRPMAVTVWQRHASSVDEDTFESFLYETVLVRGGLSYDLIGGKKKVTSWFTTVLKNLLIDELRQITQSRDLDDPFSTATFSPISEDDDRSVFDANSEDFIYTTSSRAEDGIEATISRVLAEVHERAELRGLDGGIVERVSISYLLSRYDRDATKEKLVTRADIKSELGLSEWETRKVTDAAEEIFREVLSNQPDHCRMTA